jgi:hypothetical protein
MTLMNQWGKGYSAESVGHIEIRPEEPILKRRDRLPTITIGSDSDESLQALCATRPDIDENYRS